MPIKTNEINPEYIYTVNEIADITGFNRQTIRTHIRNDLLPATSINNKNYLVKGIDIIEYLKGVI